MLALLPSLLRAALAATPGLGKALARRRWPRTEGTLAVAGLDAPVEVLRDRWGVPYLYAGSDRDLFFAQGYVHAQDRPWQLEMGRRIADGRVSELLGAAALPLDREVRMFGLRRLAETQIGALPTDTRALLDAYAAGVNARIAAEPAPLEHWIFGIHPEPWTPVDSLARGNLLAVMLNGNHRIELFRARLVAEVGEELADVLLPTHAPVSHPVVPREVRDVLRGVERLDGLDGADDILGDPNIVSGSNAWVVHGTRTKSGKPLLANDVHIGLGLPSVFHAMGLEGGSFRCVGLSLPGVPGLLSGHNGKVAWGMSNLGPDTQDLYVERLDATGTKVEVRGEWQPVEVREEVIRVRGGAPVPFAIRTTPHGPLVNEALGPAAEGAGPLALRWAHTECRPLLPTLLDLMRAPDAHAFRELLRGWESPGQNVVFADVHGHVGIQCAAKVPTRPAEMLGIAPAPGWTGEAEWTGWLPFDALPGAIDPPAGFAVAANQRPTDDGEPHLAHHWFPGYRARRIADALAAANDHDVASMVRIQRDTFSVPASILRPRLLAVTPADDRERAALDAVRAWDLRFEVDAVGATVFEAWYLHVLRRVLARVLGPWLVERYLASDYERHGSLHMPVMIDVLGDPKHPLNTTEPPDALAAAAFHDAIPWLAERFGAEPSGWAWGRVHRVSFAHAPLGRPAFGPLRHAFRTAAHPAPGENYTVDGASFLWNRPFDPVHGTTVRLVVDLADVSRTLATLVPGQVEHLGHPHREDLLAASARGETFPLHWGRAAVEAAAVARLRLEPAALAPRG